MKNCTDSRLRLSNLLAHIEGAYAPNTIRAYRADMQEFIRYCEQVGVCALPANPLNVANFLTHSATTGVKASTIKRKESSISAIHRLSYLEDPTKHPEVRIAIRKVNRKLGTRFSQAHPIDRGMFEKMLACCGNDLRGKRDRLLLRLAFETMRRRSELVSLRIDDWMPLRDGESQILLRASKTDQTGFGIPIRLSIECSQAIEDWLRASKLKDGKLLRGVKRNSVTDGLNSGQVCRIFKKLAKQAGFQSDLASRISGHSTRIGGAQELLRNGASIAQIMGKVGWTKVDTVMRYVGLSPIEAINQCTPRNQT
jgi:site-specific recombinase XerD